MDQAWSDRARRTSPEVAAAEVEHDDPHVPWRKGAKPEIALGIVFHDGKSRVYPYYSFEGMDAGSEGKITVYFVRATVEIEGYRLQELADLIRRQCVSLIREQSSSEEFAVPEGAPFIRRIWIHPPNMEALARKPLG